MSPHAVIFDVDGVLVDSYHAHLESWRALARETGVEFDEHAFAATFGRTSRDIIAKFWSRPGQPPPSEGDVRRLDERKELLYRQIVERNVPLMDGAGELIDAVRGAGFRLALGSSAPPENIELVMNALGRREAFDSVVTGRDVTRGKPDPQVFQLAAARMSVSPASCAVIEDAPAGIQAARAAGMIAIALVSTGRKRSDFEGSHADLVVDSLRELSPKAIGEFLEARKAAS